jgi:hypothetical protein
MSKPQFNQNIDSSIFPNADALICLSGTGNSFMTNVVLFRHDSIGIAYFWEKRMRREEGKIINSL